MGTLPLRTAHLTPIECACRWQIRSKFRMLGKFGCHSLELFRRSIDLCKLHFPTKPIHCHEVVLHLLRR